MPTEAEAAERWCPMVRAAHWPAPTAATNRSHQDEPNPVEARCIGSRCMMWRWHGNQARDGYCGLAGRPQE